MRTIFLPTCQRVYWPEHWVRVYKDKAGKLKYQRHISREDRERFEEIPFHGEKTLCRINVLVKAKWVGKRPIPIEHKPAKAEG